MTDDIAIIKDEMIDVLRENAGLRAERDNLRGKLEDWKSNSIYWRRRILKLEAELARIKPDWKDAPSDTHWHATDKNGVSFWYENEPTKMDNEWYSAGGFAHSPRLDWQETLEARP